MSDIPTPPPGAPTPPPGPGPSAPPPPGYSPPPPAGPTIDLGAILPQAIEIYKANFLPLFLGNLVMGIINGVAFSLLLGPYFRGMQFMVRKIRNGETPAVGDVFRGFDDFGNTFLGGLIFALCVAVATMFCYIPGLFAAAFLMHVPGLTIAGYSLGDAFNMSMERAKANFGGHILFWIAIPAILIAAAIPGYAVLFMINFLLGLLVLYGIMFVVAPLVMIAWILAFESQFETQ